MKQNMGSMGVEVGFVFVKCIFPKLRISYLDVGHLTSHDNVSIAFYLLDANWIAAGACHELTVTRKTRRLIQMLFNRCRWLEASKILLNSKWLRPFSSTHVIKSKISPFVCLCRCLFQVNELFFKFFPTLLSCYVLLL